MPISQIKFHNQGFKELRSAPGVVSDLEARAARVQAACGEGYVTGSRQGAARPQGRWRTSVVTGNAEAMRDCAKNNTLLKNLGAGA